MKLGVLTLLFGAKPFEETLDYLQSLGIEAIELGAGAYVKSAHCPTEELLSDDARLQRLRKEVEKRGLVISALSCHGNPLHPNPAIARKHHADFVSTCRLAKRLGVTQVNTLSGCPGSHAGAELPNWITCPFPAEDFLYPLQWQWKDQVIPYWTEAVSIASQEGVLVGLEMVPNNVVYNVETLLRLREAVGETIGANLDPSHLFWQGADIGAVIRKLGNAIYHFHAKDSAVNPYVAAIHGVIDSKDLTDESNRAWIFRTVGYGHDQITWNHIITQLRMAGYDGVLSIEHEDSLMSGDEGLRKAIQLLNQVLIKESPGVAYWAKLEG